jgi:hypothetical protein
LAVILCGYGATTASADVAYNEGISGDLSTVQTSPTPLTLAQGTQSIIGTLRTGDANDNRDWVAITVPAGLQIAAMTQISYVSTDTTSFSGFQTGATFTGNPGVAGSYAGYSHFGLGLNGVDILAMMDGAAGATGFTRPLAPGTYTFLFQQTGTAPTAYQFDFTVTPEPAGATLLLGGGAALLLARNSPRQRRAARA